VYAASETKLQFAIHDPAFRVRLAGNDRYQLCIPDRHLYVIIIVPVQHGGVARPDLNLVSIHILVVKNEMVMRFAVKRYQGRRLRGKRQR
jgi:hypothetical protein